MLQLVDLIVGFLFGWLLPPDDDAPVEYGDDEDRELWWGRR